MWWDLSWDGLGDGGVWCLGGGRASTRAAGLAGDLDGGLGSAADVGTAGDGRGRLVALVSAGGRGRDSVGSLAASLGCDCLFIWVSCCNGPRRDEGGKYRSRPGSLSNFVKDSTSARSGICGRLDAIHWSCSLRLLEIITRRVKTRTSANGCLGWSTDITSGSCDHLSCDHLSCDHL